MIYDPDGHELGDIPLSKRNTDTLNKDGASIVVLFHTPRMLPGSSRSGSITIRRVGERLVTDDVAAFKLYAAMQEAITELRRRTLLEAS